MNKKYEDMGKLVLVVKQFRRIQHMIGLGRNFRVIWKEEDIKARPGWIIGWRNVFDGKLRWNGNGYIFSQESAVPHVLISFYPTLKPVRVPIDGYRVHKHGELHPFCKSLLEKGALMERSFERERDREGKFV